MGLIISAGGEEEMRWRMLLTLGLVASVAAAQDPTKVAPGFYKVELENDQVRVLRVKYGPHQKSPMHSHPAGITTFLTDAHIRHVSADGKVEERKVKAGEARWSPARVHTTENLSDRPFEAVAVELKPPAAAQSPQK